MWEARIEHFGKFCGLPKLIGIQAQPHRALGLIRLGLAARQHFVKRGPCHLPLAYFKGDVGQHVPIVFIKPACWTLGRLQSL